MHWIMPNRGNPGNKTPYEMERGSPPPYKKMRLVRWGCRVTVQLSSDIRAGKFSAHTRHGFFVGHMVDAAFGTIRVYCPDTGRIIITNKWYSDPGIDDIRPQPVVMDDDEPDEWRVVKTEVPPPPQMPEPEAEVGPTGQGVDENETADYYDELNNAIKGGGYPFIG